MYSTYLWVDGSLVGEVEKVELEGLAGFVGQV